MILSSELRSVVSISFLTSASTRCCLLKKKAILSAMLSKIAVGTASPKHCLIFISSFFRKARFFSIERELSVCSDILVHLKELGIVIISISSLMLNTRSSLGCIVFWLASWSFLVWIHGPTLSQYCLRYLSPFLRIFTTISPFTTLWGTLCISDWSNADSPSFKSAIQLRICSGYTRKAWYMSVLLISPKFFRAGKLPITFLKVFSSW